MNERARNWLDKHDGTIRFSIISAFTLATLAYAFSHQPTKSTMFEGYLATPTPTAEPKKAALEINVVLSGNNKIRSSSPEIDLPRCPKGSIGWQIRYEGPLPPPGLGFHPLEGRLPYKDLTKGEINNPRSKFFRDKNIPVGLYTGKANLECLGESIKKILSTTTLEYLISVKP